VLHGVVGYDRDVVLFAVAPVTEPVRVPSTHSVSMAAITAARVKIAEAHEATTATAAATATATAAKTNKRSHNNSNSTRSQSRYLPRQFIYLSPPPQQQSIPQFTSVSAAITPVAHTVTFTNFFPVPLRLVDVSVEADCVDRFAMAIFQPHKQYDNNKQQQYQSSCAESAVTVDVVAAAIATVAGAIVSRNTATTAAGACGDRV